ncbi:MAG: acyltransferase family protein [Actinomycetota bacterium]
MIEGTPPRAGTGPSLRTAASATPPGRDRYVDFLRLASILVVVLGHWFIAVVVWRPGEIRGANALALVPGLWAATWVLQVMPVFFFIGGFSNLVSLASIGRRGGGYAEFLTTRLARLMRPTGIFIAAWLAAAAILGMIGFPRGSLLHTATQLVGQPLWFLGVYMLVVALAPPMLRLHRRFGARVLVALALGAAAVDLVRLGLGNTTFGYLNYGLVWLFAHQLGFFYADGSLARAGRSRPALTAGMGLTALVALTASGIYPPSMVGLPGDRVSNMTPPTIAIVALSIWLVGLVMLLRPPIRRWLERPRVWLAVVAGSSVLMTMFLWHLTAMLIVASVLFPLGFPQPAPGSGAWWLLRPVWVTALVAVLAPIVLAFGRFERRAGPAQDDAAAANRTTRRARAAGAAVGATLVIAGVLGFAVGGFDGFLRSPGVTLVLLTLNPAQNVLHLLAGGALLRAARRGGAAPAAISGFLLTAVGVAGPVMAGTAADGLALNAADHVLHLTAGIVSLLVAFRLARPPPHVPEARAA